MEMRFILFTIYRGHSLCGKLLVLSSDDSSRGGNNESPVCKNIEQRVNIIIFARNRQYFASKIRLEILVPLHLKSLSLTMK